VWATSTKEISRDTTYSKTRCNFLFFLSQYPLLEYNIHHHP
jgi:hypothetical protein